MALGSDKIIDDSKDDHERLINNHSVNSLMLENHEYTVTRSFGDRKYSTMCFKPSNQNMVDIVITQGKYKNGNPDLFINYIGSQDIRRKYSTKAKFGVTLVIIMLIVMLAFVVFYLLVSPPGHSAQSSTGHTTLIEPSNTAKLNVVEHKSASEGQILNYTSSAIV